MLTTIVNLLGVTINIRYQPHEGNYIEWRVIHDNKGYSPENELLDFLLRIHYTTFIESVLREHYHWHMEEQARAYPPDDVIF